MSIINELELLMKTTEGKRKLFNILGPKADVTRAIAEKAVADIIAANIFSIGGADLKSFEDARKRTTTLEKLN